MAFAAIMVVAGAASASCGISDRVGFVGASCLHAWWDNNNWPKKSTFGAQVQNDCHEWDKVVAKVDLKDCSDKTWHLTNTNKRRGSEACRVNGIYCCKDMGICNKFDYTTKEGCTSQWNKSPASETCTLSGGNPIMFYDMQVAGPQSVTSTGDDCNFWAKCQYITSEWTIEEKQASIEDVHWPDADEVYNCNGVLKEGDESC